MQKSKPKQNENFEWDEEWQACPLGLLQKALQHISLLRRRQTAKDALYRAAAVAIFTATCGLTWHHLSHPIEYHFGGIACSDVRRMAVAYLAGTLDRETASNIEVHLDLCPTCGPRIEAMHDGDGLSHRRGSHRHDALHDEAKETPMSQAMLSAINSFD